MGARAEWAATDLEEAHELVRRVELEELVLHALVVVGERLERRRRLHLHVDVATLDQVHQRPASASTQPVA